MVRDNGKKHGSMIPIDDRKNNTRGLVTNMKKNILFIHGGAPTAVMNASLYGAIMEAKRSKKIDRILAASRGTGGLLAGKLIDLTDITQEERESLLETPGSAIGTSRDPLGPDDYLRLHERLIEYHIGYVLMTGGNGTMDTCRTLVSYCTHDDIFICGIPKTMDNDLSGTDHSPGFPSAARYLAGSVSEVAQDVKALAIHIVVIESFGRDTGWLAASSVLARKEAGDAPHMILCPEQPFDEAHFLSRVEALYKRLGGVVIVASEGLRHEDGSPIVKPIFEIGRSVYFGDISSHLAQLITRRLGIKARSEKPGILGRSSHMWQSIIDRDEAIACGRASTEAVISGKSSCMSSILRTSDDPYISEIKIIPIDDEVLEAKTLPEGFINSDTYDISDDYTHWLEPLVKPSIPSYVSFIEEE